ncbi:amino acid ABC transporter substrate-binding protein, partial [Klebsiella pneumoniae]|uniref:TOBE domain-containing protein n=1 Tax=Klebsiella pneumoniae TaxID=573 RepID=UPI001ED68867|nr:amino acid ABC transporter substrate-binding protein [Klebsiella pneumoniae]
LYLRPVGEQTASFLGDTLLMTAELARGWADCARGRLPVDDRQRSGPARIMLRPEQIQIGLSDPMPRGQAVITGIDFAGFVSTLNLRMVAGGAQIEIKTVSREGLQPGSQVTLNVMGQAHIFAG